MTHTHCRKKLIEVALPLEAINAASAREKSIRHGHPSTLHLWWARRPLASARAVIFAQMVDDPSAIPEEFPTEQEQNRERERLFRLIEDFVKWENTAREALLEKARREIWKSWRRACQDNAHHPKAEELFNPDRLPAFHDPFAGGGALPLEAQRLGLEAYASDLNPVAVLINKAMIEIPPRFADRPPVNPEAQAKKTLLAREWRGAQGLADDVRYYGRWMRDEAERRIGHLYPKVTITPEMAEERPDLEPLVGRELTVIAWIWARTVRSPNPAFAHVEVPLASTFMLSTKPGKEAYVEPVVLSDSDAGADAACRRHANPGYRFTVKVGKPKDPEATKMGTKLARGANFRCLMSGMPITDKYIKVESMAGRMGSRLMAIVAEGTQGRIYLPPIPEHEEIARQAQPKWKPDLPMNRDTRDLVSGRGYGFFTWADLFTPRQLVALTTFTDLVGEAMEKVKTDYLGMRASGALIPPHLSGASTSAGAEAPSPRPHKGWHSRGYLPHLDVPGLVQSITFRLADSVLAAVIEQWREELSIAEDISADDPRAVELRKRIARYEDAGYGACYLKDPRIAELVQSALLHFDGERYRLLEWCIMPNHVHVLIETFEGYPLGDIVRSWKTFTAREANRLLGREGAFWMMDYFDRFIRDEKHFYTAREYIRQNPVRAGLCERPEQWPWSSAALEEVGRAGGSLSQATQAILPDDEPPPREGGTGARAYAEAVGVYLGFAEDKCSDYWSSICSWHSSRELIRNTFGRQAIPMVWDYAEVNPFCDSTGNWMAMVDWTWKALSAFPATPWGEGIQADASTQAISMNKVISTDPPYYDNIGYADLSDFFYVWLRRSLRSVFPDLFATVAVPKAEELVATPYRHGSKEKAEQFFLEGMTKALSRLAEQAHPAFPVTIYYAFKQSESEGNGEARRTGWETFLEAVIRAGFSITGTWPMRTEMQTRQVAMNTNALASSIVLVCRNRPENAPAATRREFLSALKEELPQALRLLQAGNIAPVDLAQAAIGPGMAVYTRYARVLDAEGKPVTVREALSLINQVLDEALAEQEGDFDPDTRWALAWFEQFGFGEGEFGVAETLSKAKNTSVGGLVEAGILESGRGRVRLLKPAELPTDWDPGRDVRSTHWEAVHHLIRVLESGGEEAAAALLVKLESRAEVARELAYRLYSICERKKRASEALSYNALVQSWLEIKQLEKKHGESTTQEDLPY